MCAKSYHPRELVLERCGFRERVVFRKDLQVYTLFMHDGSNACQAYHAGQLSPGERSVLEKSLREFALKLLRKSSLGKRRF